MHSSRMCTVCSLTVSHHILCTNPPPWQPCKPPCDHAHPPTTHPRNHAHPWQPCMPPLAATHALPATTHATPLQPCMPPCNHACPQQPCMPPCNHAPPTTMHTTQQPCMPPLATMHEHPSGNHTCLPPHLWTEFLTHASENITLPQTSFAGGNENYVKLILITVFCQSTRFSRVQCNVGNIVTNSDNRGISPNNTTQHLTLKLIMNLQNCPGTLLIITAPKLVRGNFQ